MLGKITNWTRSEDGVSVSFENGTGLVEILNAGTVRIFSSHSGKEYKSWAVSPSADTCAFRAEWEGQNLRIETPELKILVGENFLVDFYDAGMTPVCLEYRGQRSLPERYGLDGNAGAEGIQVDEIGRDYPIEVRKKLLGGECFYGLGETTGHLNKRGYSYQLWNTDDPSPHVERTKSMYADIPFFIAARGGAAYGIFFDNTWKSCFDFGQESTDYYYFGAAGGDLNYYFIYGPRTADVLGRYTGLTGKTPLPQLWALGYQQCRWSYAPEKKLLEIADEFRKRHIPCDALYLDIDYMDGYRVFTWDRTRFPNPKEMLHTLDKMGFHMVVIIDPGVKQEKGYDVYERGLSEGYFILQEDGTPYANKVWPGTAVFPDFTREEVRSWWGDNQKRLLDDGVSGIWNDMDEPATFEGEIPGDVRFGASKELEHREVHNVYGMLMAKASHDGIQKHTGKRPFVITRAAYAGVQKYSTMWTGDNQSMWEHLRLSVPMLMNLSLSGVAFCGADIGGFQYDCTPELLSRWVEAACFSPLFRNHSCTCTRNQEPWSFGPETEEIYKKYIELRYRLIPYLYDLLWQGESTGLPVLRPLFLAFGEDPRVSDINDEFMVGDRILVAPVVEQGKTARSVYLPEGDWYDFWTGERLCGGRNILREAPLDVCPIYVREGSILPTWTEREYIREKPIDVLHLLIYSGREKQSYTHYRDDGESFEYENGAYNLYECKTLPQAGGLEISVENTARGYSERYTEFQFTVYGMKASKVLLDGRPVPFRSDDGALSFSVPAEDVKIEIQSDTARL